MSNGVSAGLIRGTSASTTATEATKEYYMTASEVNANVHSIHGSHTTYECNPMNSNQRTRYMNKCKEFYILTNYCQLPTKYNHHTMMDVLI